MLNRFLRPGLLVLALVCAAVGMGAAVTYALEWSPGDTTTAAWVLRIQHAIPLIGIPLFVAQLVATACTITSTVLARRDRPSFWLLTGASVAFVLAMLVTRLGNVPINFQIEDWRAGSLPADSASVLQRWWTFHLIRTGALIAGVAALSLGVLCRRPALRS